MSVFKKILLLLLGLAGLSAAALYGYIQSLPSAAPQFVTANSLLPEKDFDPLQCNQNTQLNVAYDVTVTVTSELNQQAIYDSRLRFKTQLTQANDDVVKGIASGITINEGQGDMALQDVVFLSRIDAQQYAVFTAFDDLGLIEKHPMAIVSQLLKGLSVGAPDTNYFFSYDPLQRTYRYRQRARQSVTGGQPGTEGQSGTEGIVVERAAYPTTANIRSFAGSFSDYQSDWMVQLGKNCLPQTLRTVEKHALSVAGKKGFIRFKIEAKAIPVFTDIQQYQFAQYANSGNQWNVAGVNADTLADRVETEAQMWEVLQEFSDSKDMASLRQAANYMLDHFQATDAVNALLQSDLSDSSKRDLIFALGITGRDDAESFMLQTLASMPVAAGNAADLQKVRLMVSLAGNDKLTVESFHALANMAEQQNETPNVRNNALISMGTSLANLSDSGQGSDYLESQLRQHITEAITSPDHSSASAILAAGNARLDGLEQSMLSVLESGTQKERYAAGRVLSQDESQRDRLIGHVASEPSDQVMYAILSGWDAAELTSEQKQQLERIAEQAPAQKARLLRQFLAR
ncbi:hypothetical protein [Bacterioplanoides sp. SCSIO 12839]|uniref:hypothetical protein n=1 Tax=Bacterioplanoides sp. SCSIO 12839 TaxID=2829569 RepID=UPI00210733E4|nr:hypothetical protein [Bacterioplanoides sp. SCSIO 12839]UTW47410.1 hypothetical protein KFF03_12595 [Bacterioplanoides sp. SCSIO 12839]